MKNYYPLFVDLENKPCLLVGGGEVGEEKVGPLLDAGARVTLVSPEARQCLRDLAEKGRITWQKRLFADIDLDGQFLVIAATDDTWVNHWIFDACNTRNILVNVVDDIDHCGFIVPSIVRSGPVQVAVSTSGTSPTLAREIRKAIAREIVTEETGDLALFLARWREKVKPLLNTFAQKRAFWNQVFEAGVVETYHEAGPEAAEAIIFQLIESNTAKSATLSEKPSGPLVKPAPKSGKVTLVGAGPGAADLITLRAKDALNTADIVIYDRLANPQLLRLTPAHAEHIYAGKRKGEDAEAQQQRIHALMTGHAREGRHVVRLKGGDPFVFGRGGEELVHLARAGIAAEVVPGISSCIAAPLAARIPVTYRGIASSFGVFTGHPGASVDCQEIDWEAAARVDTAVFLMGVSRLPRIVAKLLAHGRPETTPVAVVQDAFGHNQHTIHATLGDIMQHHGNIKAPATIITGNVASLPTFAIDLAGTADTALEHVS